MFISVIVGAIALTQLVGAFTHLPNTSAVMRHTTCWIIISSSKSPIHKICQISAMSWPPAALRAAHDTVTQAGVHCLQILKKRLYEGYTGCLMCACLRPFALVMATHSLSMSIYRNDVCQYKWHGLSSQQCTASAAAMTYSICHSNITRIRLMGIDWQNCLFYTESSQ